MPLFRRRPKGFAVPKEVLLKSKVVRNPLVSWEKNEKGEVVLRVKLPERGAGLFSGFVRRPTERKIVLDEIGGYVWELADGTRTVGDILDALAKKLKVHRREVEAPLFTYLKMLADRRLIALALPPEFAKKFRREGSSPGDVS